jgi:hypothetical protein
MAKVIAPFKISETLDDINFVVTADGENYARMKGKTGITSEQFKNNPIFDRIRHQGTEFGQCSKKSVLYRQIANRFNRLAKDVSFAGRANKLLFEILEEDTTHPKGQRTQLEGLKTTDGKEILVGFESNKLRPLRAVLKTKEQYNPTNQTLTLLNFIPQEHLNWPEEGTHVHVALAVANWDFENETFDTCYILAKKSKKQTLTLKTEIPKGNHLHLTFFFIGFAKQDRKKHKFLHRKNNTTTIIASENANLFIPSVLRLMR